MFHEISGLRGFRVQDGSAEIGRLWASVISMGSWSLDGIVVQTGSRFEERCILVARQAFQEVRAQEECLGVDLALSGMTGDTSGRPVDHESSPHVTGLKTICGSPEGWCLERPVAYLAYPMPVVRSFYVKEESGCGPADPGSDTDPASCRDLIGSQVRALDGAAGSVAELIVDDGSWVVRYVILDTGRWLPGRKVILATARLTYGSADDPRLTVDLELDKIRNGPEYESGTVIDREVDAALLDYYGRKPYRIE